MGTAWFALDTTVLPRDILQSPAQMRATMLAELLPSLVQYAHPTVFNRNWRKYITSFTAVGMCKSWRQLRRIPRLSPLPPSSLSLSVCVCVCVSLSLFLCQCVVLCSPGRWAKLGRWSDRSESGPRGGIAVGQHFD